MATSTEDIIKTKRALQKAIDNGSPQDILDILNQLGKVTATQDMLRKTDVGKILGKLRTNADVAISQKAKDIVKKWKDDVVLATKAKSAATKPAAPATSNSTTTSTTSPSSNANSQRTSAASSPKTPTTESGPPRTIKSDEIKFESTGSGPRDKTVELMYGAVALGSYADSELLLKRAMAIEKAVFHEFQGVNDGYKNKVRSLALNLKSKSNPGLRESVVSGELPVHKLCTMSKEDMASEESKARDRKLAEEALFNARGAGSAQAETDMFMCGKCKGRRCTYFQMQTRSADEPMTTFVTCVSCGNHWKFC
ncbi:transcription elongation factor S-II [Zychaea mexicana]|uniref:transcription elongation factor S-II n=1 Tax=Zychaea mexicana TaxID=64656 RepID=UPI0022FDF733|nr:transcription elongation factor S-II [Zychaea mexicana]KAI9497214.1 transcription elongation factor S-II [Zychaea mexicana]